MAKPLNVLIVEDSESDTLLIVRLLHKAGYKVVYGRVDTAEGMRTALEKQVWDLVISDYSLPQFDGFAALALLQKMKPDIPFIAVSGTMGEETAVAMMKAGAHDYLMKGNLKRLVPAIERELEQAAVRRERKQAQEEMQASEERYHMIFDTSLDGVLLVAPDGSILAANPSACRIFNRTEEEIKQIRRSEIIDASDPRLEEALKERSQKGHFFGELTLIRKDGTKLPGEVSTALVKYKDGRLRTSMILRDITGRKRREEQLAESESRYKSLFEDSPISLWEEDFSAVKQRLDTMREEGITDFREYFTSHPEAVAECAALIKVIDVNKATMRMFGAKEKEDIFKGLKGILGFEPNQGFVDELINIAEGKTSFVWEGAIKTMDGRLIDIDLSWSIVPGYGNSLSRMIVSIIDITERKRAEQVLRENERRLSSIYDTVEDIISYLAVEPDEQYRFSSVNPAFFKVTGLSSEQVIGRKVNEVVHEPSLSIILGRYRQAIKERAIVHWEETFGYLDRRLIAEASIAPVFDETGTCTHLIGSVHDITERKRAEEAMRESEARYKSLFEDSPISLWEEDFSAVKQRLDALREEGITDFQEYFTLHPEAVVELIGLIKVVDVNKITMNIFGANRKEDMLKNLSDLFFVEQIPEFQKELVNIAEGKTSFEWDGSNRTLDGRLINVGLKWAVAPGFENSLSKVIVSMIDNTERKQAEEELMNERNLLRTLIDNLPDIVYVKDIEGRFMLKNLRDARQMGASSPEETIGKTDFDYYSPELAAQYRADDQTVLHSGQPIINREEPIVDASSRSGWISTTKVPLRDPQGKVIGLVGIGHDITERKQAGERIQRQLQRLAALRAIDQVVSSSFDLQNNLTEILKHVKKELGVDAADVLILNTGYQSLDFSVGVGFRTKSAEKASVRLGHSYAGRVALERQLIQVPDLNEQPHDLQLRTQLAGEDFVSYYGVPLIAKGSVKGVLEIFHRTRLDPDQEWLDFLNTIAGQAALAVDNANLFENLQRSNIDLTLAYDATIEGWSHALDLRDKETEGHTLRVTEMTLDLAGLFGIKDEELVGVRRGALLHDIGKMGVPDAILLKPTALTDEEKAIMKKHPALAFEMLSPIRYLQSAIDIPYCHHEKWDGTGYPRGLKGEQIPLSARIFAIADVWDALTSDRPYRKAWSIEKVIDHLKSGAGKHFDPQIVEVCLNAGVFDRKKGN